jgi:hypothetical protein
MCITYLIIEKHFSIRIEPVRSQGGSLVLNKKPPPEAVGRN